MIKKVLQRTSLIEITRQIQFKEKVKNCQLLYMKQMPYFECFASLFEEIIDRLKDHQ